MGDFQFEKKKMAEAILSDEVCRYFGLGERLGSVARVSGGRRHVVLKVETSEGKFAFKILNAMLIQNSATLEHFEITEQIGREFAGSGVHAVSAVQREGKSVNRVNGEAALVYPWIDGQVHGVGSVDKFRAAQMGETLSFMHGLELQHCEVKHEMGLIETGLWDVFAGRISGMNSSISSVLRENICHLNRWTEAANLALPRLAENMVLSHADLDQQNVIWTYEGIPWLIDWESASLQNPAVELLNLCLDWSGFPDNLPDKDCFTACYEAYIKANGGRPPEHAMRIAADGELAYLLEWLKFSLSRFSENSTEDELNIASREAHNALRSLQLFEQCKSTVLQWICG